MSISDTITSIENHLSADYEGLENLGADLTGINKNIQNIRTILDTIYNDLPKVTGEGTEVTLTPTRKGRLALIPKGNSTQETTTGKQLFNKNANVLSTSYCSYTYSNGVYTITPADTTHNFTMDIALELPEGTYSLNSDMALSNSQQFKDVNGTTLINWGSGYSYVHNTSTGVTAKMRFNWTARENAVTLDLNTLMVVSGNYGSSTFPAYEKYTRWNTKSKPFIPSKYKECYR